MNDQDLMTKMAEPFAGLRMTTPLEAIAGRGRALRRRRRLPALAGAAAASGAATGLTVGALLSGSGPVPTALAAWTVVRAQDGTVTVTVREFRDPAGLQRALRADGVPATVWSLGRPNTACHVLPPVRRTLDRVYTFPRHARQHAGTGQQDVFMIHPAALPPGTGVSVASNWQRPGQAYPRGTVQVSVLATRLVRASEQCTGP